jgi:hypothetical protein
MKSKKILCIAVTLFFSIGCFLPAASAEAVCSAPCCEKNVLSSHHEDFFAFRSPSEEPCQGNQCGTSDFEKGKTADKTDVIAFSLKMEDIDFYGVPAEFASSIADYFSWSPGLYFLIDYNPRPSPLFLQKNSLIC